MAAGFGVGWRQVGICLLLMMACAMIASAYGVVAVPLGREFQPSRMVLMLAMTVLSGGSALVSPLFGTLMDRVSMRLMAGIGAVLLALGFLALSFTTSFGQVLLIYGLFMAPANILIGPMAATVLLSRWFVARRGTALGIAISGIGLGGFVFPPLIQFLFDSFEWRGGLRVLALLLAALLLPAVALIVERPADRGLHPDGADRAPEAVTGGADAGPPLSTRAILSDPSFWLGVILFSVTLSGMKGMVTNLVPLALDAGVRPDRAALLISLYSLGGFVSKLGFAGVADRISLRLMMVLSLCGFGAGMACLTQAQGGYAMIATGVALVGLFGGLMVPFQGLLVARMFGQRVVGRASGLFNMVMLVALLSTPPLFGRIYDVTGSYRAIFLSFVVLAALTLAVVPFIRLGARSRGGVAAPAAASAA